MSDSIVAFDEGAVRGELRGLVRKAIERLNREIGRRTRAVGTSPAGGPRLCP